MPPSTCNSLLLSFCLFALLFQQLESRQGDRLLELVRARWTYSSTERASTTDHLEEVGRAGAQSGSAAADKIDELPGQPSVPFNQYAGYITVDASRGRALFYYYVESPHDPSSKPILLWLNGGPGCSSLGFGAMTELGPFRVNSDGKTLYANPFAWNNVANVIFLETPAGVGFSYSNTSSDYKNNGDARTARDSYAFLVNWMERFPRYKNSSLYIAGESYAGHYVPQLAMEIIRRNELADPTTLVNLGGIAIGNAYMDGLVGRFDTNTMARYEYLWTHALISTEAHFAIKKDCKYPDGSYTHECQKAISMAESRRGEMDDYSIYSPLCEDSTKKTTSGASVFEFDPCTDDYVKSYLNRPEVQRALHVVQQTQRKWAACRNVVWTEAANTTVPIVKEVISRGIPTLLYSGDVDSVVPVTSTRYYIDMLKLPVEKPWRAWEHDGEVGGYVENYEGLTFATVRGAGHEVPSYQPARSLSLITAFLKGKLSS